MSATSRAPTVECKHPDCTELGKVWEFHHGKYCCNRCEIRHDGRQAISQWKYDHSVCATCWRTLKTFNPAPPESEFDEDGWGWTRDDQGRITLEQYGQQHTADAACGFEYPTPSADFGEKERNRWIYTGIICVCGQTQHTCHDPVIADSDAIDRLIARFRGSDDWTVEADTLHTEYRDSDGDLELAVGKAVAEQ